MKYRNKIDNFKYDIFKNLEITGKYDSPVIRPVQHIPIKLLPINKVLTCKNPKEYYVHFYVDDYQFERVWKNPKIWVKKLSQFAGVIGPDFSAYIDLSMSQRIWNIFRNKVLTAYFQRHGLNVIPNARWIKNDEIDFNNGFEGLPTQSSLAITTNGTQRTEQKVIFQQELKDIITKLKPTNLIVYGKLTSSEKQFCESNNVKVFEFESHLDKLGGLKKHEK